MRQMKHIKTGQVYDIIEHIILKNAWEYYVINTVENSVDIKFCFVMGFENEFGDVYLPEIEPYIVSRTCSELHKILPAEGFTWL